MLRTLCGATAALAALVAQVPAAAAPSGSAAAKISAPDGWTVQLVHQFEELTVCMASRTQSDEGGELSVVVIGQFARLSTYAPSWPPGLTSSAVQIDFKDGERFVTPGGIQHQVLDIDIGGPLLKKLANAQSIAIQFEGHTAVFSTVNFNTAFDRAARCASAPTLDQRVAVHSPPPK